MNFTEFQSYAWIISLGSLLTVFVGWKVVYKNAKKIASRSESKAISDHLIKLINETIDLAVNYWMDSNLKTNVDSLKFSLAVSAKVTQVDDFIEILSRRGIVIDHSNLADFSTSVTLDSELHSSISQNDKAERCQACVDDGMRLISHIYTCFEKQHPPEILYPKKEFPTYLEHFEHECHGCFRPYNSEELKH